MYSTDYNTNGFDPLSKIMLELVQAGIFNKKPVISKGAEIDWDRLMDISMEQGLLSWVWEGICKLPTEQQPGRSYRINWGLSVQTLQEQYEKHESVLKKMIDICNNNNMKLLLLKGIGLSKLYPHPSSRPSSDIDIFLFEDYEKGNQLLFNNQGYLGGKHYITALDGVQVENHLWLIDMGTSIQRKVEEYLKSSLTTCEKTEDGYYVFSSENLILYVLMHLLAHLNNPGDDPLKVRSIVDFGYILYLVKDNLVLKRVNDLIKKFNLEKAFLLFVELSEKMLLIDLSRFKANNNMKNKDVGRALNLILKDEYRCPPFYNEPKCNKLGEWWRYYREIRWRYKYLPGIELTRLRIFINDFFHHLVKTMLGIPVNVSFKEGLKMKRNG